MEIRVEMEVLSMVVVVVKVVTMIMKLMVVAVVAVDPSIHLVDLVHQLVVKEGPELRAKMVTTVMEMVDKVEMEMAATKIMVAKVRADQVEKLVLQSLDVLGCQHQPLSDQLEFTADRMTLELIK